MSDGIAYMVACDANIRIFSHSQANLLLFHDNNIAVHTLWPNTPLHTICVPSPAGSTLHTLYSSLLHLMVSCPVV